MHPRYYLYLLPMLHLAVALLLALGMPHVGIAAAVMALFVAGSFPDLRSFYAREREGYREVTQWLRAQVGGEAPIIYTWGPNLAMYRFYLESFFGPSADERAIPISFERDGAATCARVGNAAEVAVVAHATHRPLATAAIEACRERYQVSRELEVRGVLGQVWTRR